ncbi:MAG: hypothetical protein ABI723_05460 [Bacteroidia bacterium]
MKSFIKILFTACAITLVSSCYYDSQEELYPLINQGTCDTTNVTYSNQVNAIISSNCLSCHSVAASTSSGGGFILETYNDLKPFALSGSLMNSLNGTGGKATMPKNGTKLSDCDISIVGKWVNDGALNN